MYLPGTLHLHQVEQVLGGKEVVLWAPILHLVVQGQKVKMVALGDPTLPHQKGDIPVICIRIPIPYKISPRCWWRVFWGCIQLSECKLPAEILHELAQFIIYKIPQVCLPVLQGSPTKVGVVRG